eukprot:SM000038S14309  [mRNA]  locus=s38:159120:160865:- [translate_table: standard]
MADAGGRGDDSCAGRRVYMYDLPPRFNTDLLAGCADIFPWTSACEYFENEGLGAVTALDSKVHWAGPRTRHLWPSNAALTAVGVRAWTTHPSHAAALAARSKQVLVPRGTWYKTHQYSLDIIFHSIMRQHACLTTDAASLAARRDCLSELRPALADAADAFYVPFYAGWDVLRWNLRQSPAAVKDALGQELLAWLADQPPFARRGGAGHFVVLGKIADDFRRQPDMPDGTWGSNLLFAAAMAPVARLTLEACPDEQSDHSVPHPVYFHPASERDLRLWQRRVLSAHRTTLVSFAGLPRPEDATSIRSILMEQCSSAGAPACMLLECHGTACLGPEATVGELFLHSSFCLQPRGDSPTRRSVFDALLAGCIPVLFHPRTAYDHRWHLPADNATWSIFFPEWVVADRVVDVIASLAAVPEQRVHAMRRAIVTDILPGLLYFKPGARHPSVRDAFDISIDHLLDDIHEQALRLTAAADDSKEH